MSEPSTVTTQARQSPPGPALLAAGERRRLVALVAGLAPAEGANPTAVPGVEVNRATRPSPRRPVITQPSICIVAQGSKRAYHGDMVYAYDPLHYLVLSVPLPIEGEIVEASPEAPYLALKLGVDAVMLGELLFDMGERGDGSLRQRARRGISVSRLDERLLGSVMRLLRVLQHPLDARILGREALREILYHVLTGEQGDLLRAVALADSRIQRLAGVLRRLQTHYEEPLDVATLARQAGMSPTTLHHQFRAVTATSPLQYLKTVRLHQALRLMLHDGLGAAQAAYRVGYGSASQFSREFKRLFGASPRSEVAKLNAGVAPVIGR
ncbi:MAG TPA: AraC family transcriptional regulator [Thermoanaerobaculia bacterium]|nr:AraC family transcriptional regulator [Thermoanaerobaculia bacterium]